MVPQTPELNRGAWERIERAVRRLAVRRGELYVVTGPAYQGQRIQSIGPDGVLVSSSIWKAIYDPRASGTGAYLCSNAAAPRCETVSVVALARGVGIDLFPAVSERMKQTAVTLPWHPLRPAVRRRVGFLAKSPAVAGTRPGRGGGDPAVHSCGERQRRP